jgi:hypothetical protein
MTTFKNILDRASITMFKDYKLDNIYKIDPEAFYEFMRGFLSNSVDMFEDCLTSLDYHIEIVPIPGGGTEEMYVFNANLSSKEEYILALGVTLGWFNKHILDLTQFETHIQDRNFKSFSEANNLDKKTKTYNSLYEEFTRQVAKYQILNLDKLPFFGGG